MYCLFTRGVIYLRGNVKNLSVYQRELASVKRFWAGFDSCAWGGDFFINMASGNQNMMRFLWAVVLFLSLVKQGRSLSLGTPFDGPNNDPYSDGDRFAVLTGSPRSCLNASKSTCGTLPRPCKFGQGPAILHPMPIQVIS